MDMGTLDLLTLIASSLNEEVDPESCLYKKKKLNLFLGANDLGHKQVLNNSMFRLKDMAIDYFCNKYQLPHSYVWREVEYYIQNAVSNCKIKYSEDHTYKKEKYILEVMKNIQLYQVAWNQEDVNDFKTKEQKRMWYGDL